MSVLEPQEQLPVPQQSLLEPRQPVLEPQQERVLEPRRLESLQPVLEL